MIDLAIYARLYVRIHEISFWPMPRHGGGAGCLRSRKMLPWTILNGSTNCPGRTISVKIRTTRCDRFYEIAGNVDLSGKSRCGICGIAGQRLSAKGSAEEMFLSLIADKYTVVIGVFPGIQEVSNGNGNGDGTESGVIEGNFIVLYPRCAPQAGPR